MDKYVGPICIYKRITGHECWGCGTRHAMYEIMNLEFIKAFNHNKLSFIIFGILVYLWFKYIFKEVNTIRKMMQKKDTRIFLNKK